MERHLLTENLHLISEILFGNCWIRVLGKILLKLKSFAAVEMFRLKLESLNELGKLTLKLEISK